MCSSSSRLAMLSETAALPTVKAPLFAVHITHGGGRIFSFRALSKALWSIGKILRNRASNSGFVFTGALAVIDVFDARTGGVGANQSCKVRLKVGNTMSRRMTESMPFARQCCKYFKPVLVHTIMMGVGSASDGMWRRSAWAKAKLSMSGSSSARKIMENSARVLTSS